MPVIINTRPMYNVCVCVCACALDCRSMYVCMYVPMYEEIIGYREENCCFARQSYCPVAFYYV